MRETPRENSISRQIIQLGDTKNCHFLKIIFSFHSHRPKRNEHSGGKFYGHFLSSMSFCGPHRRIPTGAEPKKIIDVCKKVDIIIISEIILANPILFVIEKIAFAKSLFYKKIVSSCCSLSSSFPVSVFRLLRDSE